MKKGYQDNLLNGLIVDNFAGGGGASALIRANCPHLAYKRPLKTVKELEFAMCG